LEDDGATTRRAPSIDPGDPEESPCQEEEEDEDESGSPEETTTA
jgi:hypothetical protein